MINVETLTIFIILLDPIFTSSQIDTEFDKEIATDAFGLELPM